MRRLVLTVILAFSWGSSFLWIKYALDAFSPTEITTIRLLLGAAICLVATFIIKARLPREPAVLIRILGAGVLANAAPYILFAIGEQRTSSAIAGLINSTSPLWALLGSWALRDKGISRRTVLGMGLGFAGTVTMLSPGFSSNTGQALGVIACLAASACYGLSYVYVDRLIPSKRYSLLSLSACQLALAGILSIPFALYFPHGSHTLRINTVLPLILLGVLGTSLAYVIYYAMIRNYGALAASTVSYLIPLVAVILGVSILNESLSIWTIVGGVITICGVVMTRDRAAGADVVRSRWSRQRVSP